MFCHVPSVSLPHVFSLTVLKSVCWWIKGSLQAYVQLLIFTALEIVVLQLQTELSLLVKEMSWL